MTIPHFAAEQTDVFIPALAVLAVAALFAVLPVIFAPALRRRRGGRALTGGSIVLAAAALVLAAVQAGAGFRTLGDERAHVLAEVNASYGLHIDAEDAGTLIDGGGLVLKPEYPTRGVRFRLRAGSTDDYSLVYGKGATAVPLPVRS